MSRSIQPSRSDANGVERTELRFDWRSQALLSVVMIAAITVTHLLIGWYNGRGIRPFALAGMAFWLTTVFALGSRRRWIKARRPELALRPWRFSFVELLVVFTGLTLLIGLSITDRQESLKVRREQATLQSSATKLLGLDGRIDFDADGSLMISICDRSFDDARFVTLVQMIDDWNKNAGVSRITFGTGINTSGMPPVWLGVTDRSIDLLLKYDELEWLSVYGTAISADGRERLLTLPRLNDFSRNGLKTTEKP